MHIENQARAAAGASTEARRAEAARMVALYRRVSDLRLAGQYAALLVECGLPLVRAGGALGSVRADWWEAAFNSNAGAVGYREVYELAAMGGEPYAIWN